MTVSLKYDDWNRVRVVVFADDTQVGLVYDHSGLWQGFSFADGGKMLFKRNAAGEIIGLRRVAKSVGRQAPDARRVAGRRVGFGAPLAVDDCAAAVTSATAAALVAAATCSEGPSVQCAAALANAAVAAKKAYDACRDASLDGPAV